MKAFIVVATTGRGKTTFVKDLLRVFKNKGSKLIIYDPNREYFGEFHNNTQFLDEDIFLKQITERYPNGLHKITNTTIVFEEATIFFPNTKKSKGIRDLLVSKRHTKNNIIFVFHSLRTVPVEIIELVNFIVLFKTDDREDIINNRFKFNPEILSLFNSVQKESENNFHYYEILSKNNI
jgi:DNA helicase HerA-like ATPase